MLRYTVGHISLKENGCKNGHANTHTPHSHSPLLSIGKQKAITGIYSEGKVPDCLSLAASS